MAHDRTGQPVVETHTNNVPDGSQTLSCHESISFNVGDGTIRDRTGQPVVNCDESSHEQTMLNEVNMDFRIPGLPHSVVKQAESSRVREMVQQDLQQNKAYNPFSAKSKQMIQDVGNVELFELFETDPKTQRKACLSYWSEGIVYCTCRASLERNSGQSKFHCKYDHYRQNWWISLNKSGSNTEPVRKRSDFNQALSTLNRVHQEAEGQQLKPMPYWKYKEWKSASSSSSTWWQWRESCGLPKNSKEVNKRGCKQRFAIERSNPLFTKLWRKPQRNGFQEFIRFCYR